MLAGFFGDRQVIYNGSSSLPTGLYVRVSGAPILPGAIVDFPIPPTVRSYVEQRVGRVGAGGWYILKPVAAVAGDHVDTTGDQLLINGQTVAPIVTRNRDGGAVPVWRGSRRLEAGELFVVSTRIPDSFDSRSYGPIRESEVTGVYESLRDCFWGRFRERGSH